MAIPIRYAEWRSRLREYLSDKETPLDLARMIRYALLQGPWQPWMIHHYQRHGRNPRLPSTDRRPVPLGRCLALRARAC